MKKYAALLFALLCVLHVSAQAPYASEPSSYIDATFAHSNFWFNIGNSTSQSNEVLYKAAAAAHAGGVRLTCGWEDEELFAAYPSNASAGYQLDASCLAGLTYAAKYSLGASVTLSYQSPYRVQAYVTPTSNISVGDTTVNLTLVAGNGGYNWSNVQVGITNVCDGPVLDNGLMQDGASGGICSGAFSTARKTYNNGLVVAPITIIDSTHATMSLSTKATVAINALNKTVTGCSFTALQNKLTCPAGTFDSSMVGKTRITVSNMGQGGAYNATLAQQTIKSVTSDTVATMSYAPYTTQSNVTVTITRLLSLMDQMYTSPQTVSATDPSAIAYAHMAAYIATRAKALGVPYIAIEQLNEIGGGFQSWYNPSSYRNYASGGNWNSASTYYLTTTFPGQGGIPTATVMRNGTCYMTVIDGNTNHDPATDSAHQYWTTTIPSNAYCGVYNDYALPVGLAGAIQNLNGTSYWPDGAESWFEGTWNNGVGHSLQEGILSASGVSLASPATNLTAEVSHPYTVYPEEPFAPSSCLDKTLQYYVPGVGLPSTGIPISFNSCHYPSSTGGANIVFAFGDDYDNYKLRTNGDQYHAVVTESGLQPAVAGNPKNGTWAVRQYLAALSDHIYPFEFFQIYSGDTGLTTNPVTAFGWLSLTTDGTAVSGTYPQYNFMQKFMEDIAPISNPTVSYTSSNLPTLSTVSGNTYPLIPYHIVGKRIGNVANSDFLVVMQHTSPAVFTASATNGVMTVTALTAMPTNPGTAQNQRTVPLAVGRYLQGGPFCNDSVLNSSACATVAYQGLRIASQTGGTTNGVGTYTLTNNSGNASTVSFASQSITTSWDADPPPTAATVVYNIPSGMQVTSVVDMVTRTTPNCTTTSSTITCPVAENPLGIMFDPIATYTTWYVRPDGGSRYSANFTSGQCDGKHDAAYPGTGTNQPCAFGQIRNLYDDGTYKTTTSGYNWAMSGGDTAIVRGSIGTGVSYRVGWNNPNTSNDSATGQYWGLNGDPFNSYIPVPPAGTSTQHTRILGENYQACTTQNAKTQLHGGYGIYEIFDLEGANYVDVACFDLTDQSNCSLNGNATYQCNKNIGSLTDFAKNGVSFSQTSTNISLTDISAHGLDSGLHGPTGDGVNFNRIALYDNAHAGWDSDGGEKDANGNSLPASVGVGTATIQNFNFSWNGCVEEYPIVDPIPVFNCADDSSAGYGDAFGTATVLSTTPWHLIFRNGITAYNTQDGLDALHLVGAGSSLVIDKVLTYGNMGQQIKVGGANASATNNIIVGNCNALRLNIPGTPNGYNSSLSDFCRANDEGTLITVGKGSTTVFDNNTVFAANNVGVVLECDTSNGNCDTTSLLDFRNNVFVGFPADVAHGYPNGANVTQYSDPLYVQDASANASLTNNGSFLDHNAFFNIKGGLTRCQSQLGTNTICTDPQLTDESWHNYGYGNLLPKSTSPLVNAALSLSNVTSDYTGAVRGGTMGALESTSTFAGNIPAAIITILRGFNGALGPRGRQYH